MPASDSASSPSGPTITCYCKRPLRLHLATGALPRLLDGPERHSRFEARRRCAAGHAGHALPTGPQAE
eukprot:14780977-Alexandrium_andersonii.AAC.1